MSPRTQNTNFRIPPEWVRVNDDIFIWKEFRGVRRGWQHYSDDFRSIGRNFDPDMVVTHKSKIQKIRFFSISPKFDLDDSRYRIRVPNHSRTPQMSFSGHISISQTISATLKKIVFWAKNHDFCQIWWIIIWYVIWPEVAENLKYVLKCVLQVPKILLNPQNAIIQCMSLILLRFQKFSFSPIFHVFGHFGENCQKPWF